MYLRVLTENSKSGLIDLPRYRHLISRLHEAGPRPIGEFIGRLHRLCPDLPVMDLLEDYASVDLNMIRRIGADKWPPAITLVPDSILSGRATHAAILRRSLQPVDGGDAA
jgi:hypothetical protein